MYRKSAINKTKIPFVSILYILVFYLGIACNSEESYIAPTGEISEDSLRIYTKTLASDEFLGRMPFTPGEKITVDYLQKKLTQFGLEPGNGDQFVQEVPLVDIEGFPANTLDIELENGNMDMELGLDFVAYTQQEATEVSLDKSEIIFCGYGINAPEQDWNDFEGVDVKGKTIIVLVNDPGLSSKDSTFFKGRSMTYYGRWTYKYEEAARQGAAGVFIVHEPTMAGYPWFVVRNSWAGSQQNIQSENKGSDKCAVQGWLTLEAAQKLFTKAGLDFSTVFKSAAQPGFKPIPLNATASIEIKNKLTYNTSQNVVAKISGSGPENIIFSAHWDHFGVSTPIDGDSIYNGAVDNATGVAALMEIARTYKENNIMPKRSLVFLFVTAEEQGLLGSQYYSEHPIYPPRTTMANLNLDAIEPLGLMKDVTMIGYGHSTFDEITEAEAALQNRYIIPDQEAEKGYFFRSDHFNFAKIGIPALYAKGSYEHQSKGVEYAKSVMDQYTAQHYHQPSDEYREDMDFSGIQQDGQLYYNIGWRIATGEITPEWKPISEFAAYR
ncbi:M28 family metallopeptidase [Membranihabitans marinus]|uniref:M28 family metallopeptidase n=1 Tax=Membranihabitans marinus TaxID=1227546 RepID=UPI001F348CD7|nr:M28 family metallopeptidase [Membranihabitans marinus]